MYLYFFSVICNVIWSLPVYTVWRVLRANFATKKSGKYLYRTYKGEINGNGGGVLKIAKMWGRVHHLWYHTKLKLQGNGTL